MSTRTFTVEELDALGVPHDLPEQAAVADFHVTNGRWAERRRCILTRAGAFWAVDYARPLPGGQDVVDHGWGRCVEATQVVPARVTTTTWVPADTELEAEPAVDVWIVEVRWAGSGSATATTSTTWPRSDWMNAAGASPTQRYVSCG
ncbi:hypothetical protein [Streptomyces sp. WM6378]|uniref:hypothetical protein n=1 Tax=Streptomyces sp. WM6378 TaxID=1415557 RepID=UPI0006AD87EB|nr:hypothetical protein [Streptomyces sp. WM6378]KOU43246.1 hypothetical protein ADK54_18245 [Streptomyces sp. WM6378]